MSSAEPIQLPQVWIGIDDHAIEMASQFLAEVQAPGELIITIGPSSSAHRVRSLPVLNKLPNSRQ